MPPKSPGQSPAPKRPSDPSTAAETKRFLAWILAGFAVLLVVSFAFSWITGLLDRGQTWDERSTAIQAAQRELALQVSRVKAAAGNDCTYDGECKIIGLGARACQYHKDYLVYSLAATEAENLQRAVEKMNEAAQKLNLLSMEVPGCGSPPKLPRCVSGKCRVVDN